MKPVQQVFGLVLQQINGFSKLESKYKTIAGRSAKIYLCSPSEGAESFKN